jgi:hypothetical protein
VTLRPVSLLSLQLQWDLPLHHKHDATSRISEPTSENSVQAKFAELRDQFFSEESIRAMMDPAVELLFRPGEEPYR